MKKQTKKEQVINELIGSVLKLPIKTLHQELMDLDSERYLKVLNKLTPEKFLEFVKYDADTVDFSSIWSINFDLGEGIKKELLDILPPHLLIRIAAKNSVDIGGAWGRWKNDQNHYGHGYNLSRYFSVASPKRVLEIINFLFGSCLNVKAPASAREKDIFLYKKEKEFPFEAMHLFSSVHPRVFFPALNLVSNEYLKKILWLYQKSLFEGDGLENIFQDEYCKDYTFNEDVFNCIAEHIGILKDEHLISFLRLFNGKTQEILIPKIGKERIVQLHKNNFSIKSLYLPEEWKIFSDKKSNESVFEKIQKGSQSVGRLNPKKKVELLGALL